MELSLNQISKMRPKKNYLALLSTFSSIYESYAFVNIKEEQYRYLVLKTIYDTKDKYTGELPYSKFITKELQKALSEIIKKSR